MKRRDFLKGAVVAGVSAPVVSKAAVSEVDITNSPSEAIIADGEFREGKTVVINVMTGTYLDRDTVVAESIKRLKRSGVLLDADTITINTELS